MMTIEQIRALYEQRPFQPFEIHLADGRTLTVEHPELMSRSVSGRTIAASRPDDVIETIDLLLVVSINPRPNGASRRRR
ncbi:MAG TPA: hypothetical protein VG125_19745, partial [Pirellulales bacterium]|nr:hypothetical protein [Pirellulales bacterium]